MLGFQDHGNHVMVLLRHTFEGLQGALHLPCTDWVLQNSGVQEPQFSAKIVGDSTLLAFRVAVCNQLRLRHYDVKTWMCQSELRNMRWQLTSLVQAKQI